MRKTMRLRRGSPPPTIASAGHIAKTVRSLPCRLLPRYFSFLVEQDPRLGQPGALAERYNRWGSRERWPSGTTKLNEYLSP
jgi:hypothetical protein